MVCVPNPKLNPKYACLAIIIMRRKRTGVATTFTSFCLCFFFFPLLSPCKTLNHVFLFHRALPRHIAPHPKQESWKPPRRVEIVTHAVLPISPLHEESFLPSSPGSGLTASKSCAPASGRAGSPPLGSRRMRTRSPRPRCRRRRGNPATRS